MRTPVTIGSLVALLTLFLSLPLYPYNRLQALRPGPDRLPIATIAAREDTKRDRGTQLQGIPIDGQLAEIQYSGKEALTQRPRQFTHGGNPSRYRRAVLLAIRHRQRNADRKHGKWFMQQRLAMPSDEADSLRQPPRLADGAARHDRPVRDRSFTSCIGMTSTCAPPSVRVLPMASATSAVDPARLAYVTRILLFIIGTPFMSCFYIPTILLWSIQYS